MTQLLKNAKITLYALREMHFPILWPVYEELKKLGFENLSFTSPPFLQGTPEWPEEGLKSPTIELLQSKNIPFLGSPGESKHFDCVITADACYDRVEGLGPVICIGHGTISKNIFYIDQPICRRENYASLMCVPGEWYQNCFGNEVSVPLLTTGFAKMDDLSQDYTLTQMKLFARIGFSTQKTTLLFAPTYNDELSTLEFFWNEWKNLPQDKYQVLVKLHGATSEYWRTQYRELCQKYPHFFYVEDQNIAPYCSMANAMISDLSSAYLEFMATHKPVILGENPRFHQSAFKNEKSIECIAREFCYIVQTPSELINTIELACLKDPQKQQRSNFIQNIFAPLDGRNCERIALGVLDFLKNKESFKPPFMENISVLIPSQPKHLKQTLKNLERMEFISQIYSLEDIELGDYSIQKWDNQALSGALVILDSPQQLPWNWDRIWLLSRKWFQGPGIFGPLLPDSEHKSNQNISQLLGIKLNAEQDHLQKYCKYQLMAHTLPCEHLDPGLIFLPSELPFEISSLLWRNTHKAEAWTYALKNLHKEGVFLGAITGILAIDPLA